MPNWVTIFLQLKYHYLVYFDFSILSFVIAFCQSFLFWSNETLNISNPFALYFPYSFTNCRLDDLQGPHQLAQKSSRITFPFKDSKESESPFTVGNLIRTRESVILGNCCAFKLKARNIRPKTGIVFLRFIDLKIN